MATLGGARIGGRQGGAEVDAGGIDVVVVVADVVGVVSAVGVVLRKADHHHRCARAGLVVPSTQIG